MPRSSAQAIGTASSSPSLVYGIGALCAWAYQKRVDRLDASAPLVLWVPVLLFWLAWLGVREGGRIARDRRGRTDAPETRGRQRDLLRRARPATARSGSRGARRSPRPGVTSRPSSPGPRRAEGRVVPLRRRLRPDLRGRPSGSRRTAPRPPRRATSTTWRGSSSSSSSSSPSSSGGGWTGGGGAFGGAGASRHLGRGRGSARRGSGLAFLVLRRGRWRRRRGRELGRGRRRRLVGRFRPAHRIGPVSDTVSIVGAGLAGSECAWQLARRGHRVRLFEMRPKVDDGGARDGPLRRARLLELLPVGQPAERGRAAQARDGAPRLARHPVGARGGRAGRATLSRWTGTSSPTLVTEAIAARPRDRARAGGGRRDPAARASSSIATGPLTSPALDRRDRGGCSGPRTSTSTTRSRRSSRPRRSTSRGCTRMSRYGKGRGRGLLELPADARGVRGVRRRSCSRARRSRSRTSRRAIYFEGCLPDRGDGRARDARRCGTGR